MKRRQLKNGALDDGRVKEIDCEKKDNGRCGVGIRI